MPTLSRILHFAHGIPSYHNSLIELADRLRSAGIELIVVSHNDLSGVLQPYGHEFIHLKADIDLEQRRQAALATCRSYPHPIRYFRQFIISKHFRQQSLRSTELHELIHKLQPGLLLMDMECHKAIVQGHTLPIPLVLLSRWYTVFKGDNVPPMHTQLQPSRNTIDTLRIQWSWTKLRLFKTQLTLRQHLSSQIFRSVTYKTNSRADLKALARSYNLSASKITDTSHWLIPHVYTKLPVMSLTIEALEFKTAKDSRMNYVGAMVGAQDKSHPNYEDSIELFRAFHNKRSSQANPLVYCSLSTFWNTKQDIIKTLIDLFRRRPDLDLVMGLGGKQTVEKWSDLPDNILLLGFAPQLQILKHAAIAITHGGVSTINEAMIHGTPVIVCSSGHVDQNGCAARVAHSGVGHCCQLDPLDVSELEKHINDILDDADHVIRNKVQGIQNRQMRYDSENTVVRFLNNAASTNT